jgi:serine protease Do
MKAAPIPTLVLVTDQLLHDGEAIHPYLGISIGRVTPAIEDVFGMEIDHGALVLGVDAGSPAAAAGLRPGDVIVELAGVPVRTVEDLLGRCAKQIRDNNTGWSSCEAGTANRFR